MDSIDERNNKQSVSPTVAFNENNSKRVLRSTFIGSILALSIFTVIARSFLTLNPDVNALQQRQLQFLNHSN